MTGADLLAILRKTKSLVADPSRWAEHNFAEDPAGKWVPVGSEAATRFNLAGAFMRSAGASSREAARAFGALLSTAPSWLATEHWWFARGLTRTQALDILEWAIQRFTGVAGASVAELDEPQHLKLTH